MGILSHMGCLLLFRSVKMWSFIYQINRYNQCGIISGYNRIRFFRLWIGIALKSFKFLFMREYKMVSKSIGEIAAVVNGFAIHAIPVFKSTDRRQFFVVSISNSNWTRQIFYWSCWSLMHFVVSFYLLQWLIAKVQRVKMIKIITQGPYPRQWHADWYSDMSVFPC